MCIETGSCTVSHPAQDMHFWTLSESSKNGQNAQSDYYLSFFRVQKSAEFLENCLEKDQRLKSHF